MLKMVSSSLTRINVALSYIGGWLLFGMMVLLVVDVVWRNFFTPLHALVELSVFAMMIIIYLGLAACEENDEHVRLEFFVMMLPPKLRLLNGYSVGVLNVIATAILFYAVYRSGMTAYLRGEATSGNVTFPLWPIKFIMIAGMAFFLIEAVRSLIAPKAESDSDEPGLDASL
ncbi:MAG: hypothetical protein COA78_00135 [Blastopirellula sp.]|nr:MAG: hypothetical protein COA78_00135 [Blastopirellula sp.]